LKQEEERKAKIKEKLDAIEKEKQEKQEKIDEQIRKVREEA